MNSNQSLSSIVRAFHCSYDTCRHSHCGLPSDAPHPAQSLGQPQGWSLLPFEDTLSPSPSRTAMPPVNRHGLHACGLQEVHSTRSKSMRNARPPSLLPFHLLFFSLLPFLHYFLMGLMGSHVSSIVLPVPGLVVASVLMDAKWGGCPLGNAWNAVHNIA